MAELLDNRVLLLMQLRSMETEYMTELQYLMIEYWQPLKTRISSQEHQRLFGNLECIAKLTHNYLQTMNEIDSDRKQQMGIAQIILKHYQQTRDSYLKYYQNYDTSNQLLQHLFKNNAKFFNFCQNVHKSHKNGNKNRNNKNNHNLSLLLRLPLKQCFKICNQISDIIVRSSSAHFDDDNALKQSLLILSELTLKCKQIKTGNNKNNKSYFHLVNELLLSEKYYISQIKSFLNNGMGISRNNIANNPKFFADLMSIIDSICKFHIQFSEAIQSRLTHLKNTNTKNDSHQSQTLLFADIWKTFIHILSNYHKIINSFHEIKSVFTALNIPLFTLQTMALKVKEYAFVFDKLSKSVQSRQTEDFLQLQNTAHCLKRLENEMKPKLKQIYPSFVRSLFELRLDSQSRNKYSHFKSETINHKYLFEGYLLKLSVTTARNRVYLFILFSDSLILCSLLRQCNNTLLNVHSLNGYKHANTAIHIHRIIDTNDSALSVINYSELPPNNNKFGFAILSSTESFMVCAQNMSDKSEWIARLNDRMNSNTNISTKYVRPCTLLLPYSFSQVCMIDSCTHRFGINTQNRFHCRSCGRIICHKCCDYQIKAYERPTNLIRVCRDCKEYCGSDTENDTLNINDCEDDDLMMNNGNNNEFEDDDLFIGNDRHRYKIPNQVSPRPNKRTKLL